MIRDSVLEAIGFIEENLQHPILVQDAANKACYSLYHFIRLFEGVTGHTPKDYILRRRITEAFKELKGGSKKVIDVGFDYQFGSPEAFARAFKRITGINPARLKKGEYYPELNLLNPIDKETLPYTESLKELEVREVSLESLDLSGMVTLIREDKGIIDELWRYMSREIPYWQEEHRGPYYGHSYWSNDYDLKGFFLLCGWETTSYKHPDSPLCRKSVPAGRYLQFIHRGKIEHIQYSYKYIFQTYLPKTEYTLSKPYDLEVYLSGGKSPHQEDAETEILIPID